MRYQLGIPGQLVLDAALGGRAGRQVDPAFSVQHGRDSGLRLQLDIIHFSRTGGQF
jgi:hypothetical protein